MRAGRTATPEVRAAFAALTQSRSDTGARMPMMRHARHRRYSVRRRAETRAESRRDAEIARAFGVVISASQTGAPIDLVPCCVNGESSLLIALTRDVPRGLEIMPLFVALTSAMTITPRDSTEDDGEEGHGATGQEPHP